MSHLTLLGLLAFLAISVWAQDNNPVRDNLNISGTLLPTRPSYKKTNAMVHGNVHKLDLEKKTISAEWYLRRNSQKRIKLTPFEKRVVRVLRKFGLLDNDNTAERVVESLRKDKDLLRKLKKLLDDVAEEDESDDFFTSFWDLFFS
ncbi:uncharacterized protein [Drosophila kikkawai]|uniref:RxLR effector protein n=1 Tax=Drosophila kikkawai TaxID=30033 RepID=A0ABM4GPB9_DROKI